MEPAEATLVSKRGKGTWGKTQSNREAKYYAITKAGEKALDREMTRWRRMAGLVERLLVEDFQP